jgi:hypothetical protein
MNQKSAQRVTVILGVVMVAAIALSAILPLFTGNNSAFVETPAPTAIPSPTFPPQPSDLTAIKFDTSYLHPTGIFSVALPTGWQVSAPNTKPDNVEVSMNNGDLQSVIQASVGVPSQPVADLDQLSAIYDASYITQSWSNYRNPRELTRRKEGDKLLIDFELQNGRGQTMLARQSSWTDGQWIYSVRVVTPETMVDLLKYVLDNETATLKPNKQFAGIPFDWPGYFDQTTGYIIRYPATWSVTDSGLGRPASISGPNAALRVEAQANASANDEAAARKWVEDNVPGATIVSVKPVERAGAKGFQVAYSVTTPDGDKQSGAALLLNGPDTALHIANLRLNTSDVDLNSDAAATGNPDAVKVLSSFQAIAAGLKLPPPPTATPMPTAAFTPTPEATATVEVTPEATVETTTEATAEATAGS